MLKRHGIQFPQRESSDLNQDEAYFYLQGSGAGNGMMGEELKKHGVSRLVGVDYLDTANKTAGQAVQPRSLQLPRPKVYRYQSP